MSTLQELLRSVVQELDEIHVVDGFKAKVEDYLPNYVLTRSGAERHFTKTAQGGVIALAKRLFTDRPVYREVMRKAEFSQVLRSCIADLHAEGALAGTWEDKTGLKVLEAEVELRLQSIKLPFGHGFAATTLRLEEQGPYQVGPVDVRSIGDWLETVALNERSLQQHGIDPKSNWKADLLAVLNATTRSVRPDVPPHLRGFVDALHGADAVVSVAVLGLEQTYSREVARMAARTALDGVSLLAGRGGRAFSQQALSNERLQPLWLQDIIVFKGEHWVGGGWSDRAVPSGQGCLRERVFEANSRFTSLCEVVASQIDSRSHRHPQLAARWATALEWHAEGCRESSTSMAVTKLAASLDILTCGKLAYGITQMLAHLLNCAPGDQVFKEVPSSLSNIVHNIYGEGRSRLLHGNQVNRRIAFDEERGHAQALGALALIFLLERLGTYQGQDVESAFMDMPQ